MCARNLSNIHETVSFSYRYVRGEQRKAEKEGMLEVYCFSVFSFDRRRKLREVRVGGLPLKE